MKRIEDLKVGDKVKITKSSRAWNTDIQRTSMDNWDGKIVEISSIEAFYYEGIIKHKITFPDDGRWTWCYEHGHFEVLDNPNQNLLLLI